MLKTLLKILCPAMNIWQMNVAAATVGAAAIGAVGSAVSSSNAADAQASAAQNANSPWSAAQPYISGEFQNAQDALHAAQGMGTYSGERVAGLNPYQSQGANSTAQWASGNGANTANQFYNTGMGMSNAGAGYGSNASSLLSAAQQDPTQGFMNYANGLANSDMANQMIDAANRDVSRDLNESKLPSLALTAAGTGNTDSTRTGVTQAILQRNASEQMADTASNIRSQLFNTGLQTAQSQYNQNADRALNANQQVGNAYQMGNTALLNGQQANGNNFDQMQAAGGVFQNQQQSQDQAAYQQFQEQQTTPLNLIGQYMNVINGKWGGPAVSSVGPSVAGSTIQGAVGAGMMGYGATQKLGGYSNNTPASSALGGVGYAMPDNTGAGYYSGGGNTYGFTTS